MERRDVVIVGAGPVGLSLALGLARKGVDVLVLEKDAGTAEHSRAPAIWPGTQEVLARLGVIDRFMRAGLVHRAVQLWDADHDRVLLRLPIEDVGDLTRYPHLLVLPQSKMEAFLLDALSDLACAEVRFGAEVVGVDRRPAAVEARYVTSGHERRVAARFVAGCDGAHSRMREAVGASLEGITYPIRASLADLQIAADADRGDFRLTTRPRPAIGIRIGERLWRLILPHAVHGNAHDDEEDEEADDALPFEERKADAVRALFAGAACETLWQSTFRLHRRVSTRWLDGRIVLAGDAAHLNSPVGGEGMNAGILDADALADALFEALQTDDLRALNAYVHRRRRAIEHGVNPFTGVLTRVLLAANGRFIRPTLLAADLLLRVGPVRRRVLRRLTMLDAF